jgi:hypothetical protein
MILKLRAKLELFMARIQTLPRSYLIVTVALSGVVSLAWDHVGHSGGDKGGKAESSASVAADTFIPAGYVLVPIQVANYESVDSILGKFGVVDLFASSLKKSARPEKVAGHVRILRAPLNPSQFAVLVPEIEAPRLVQREGPFFVVIQNPKETGMAFVNTHTNPRPSRIITEQNYE